MSFFGYFLREYGRKQYRYGMLMERAKIDVATTDILLMLLIYARSAYNVAFLSENEKATHKLIYSFVATSVP